MLTVIEGRVLGALLEKERTVPDQYPLSLNALVLACNQSSSREPVMSLTPEEVEAAIAAMKVDRWVRIVHPTHGRGVTKYRQVATERLGLDEAEAALLAVLLLRGPQTAAELRARTERLHGFESVGTVEASLQALARRDEPLVRLLERRPGQKEQRWQQRLAEEAEVTEAPSVVVAPTGSLAERVAELEARLARLEAALGLDAPGPDTSGSVRESVR